ncbi:hypothetical protein GCM10027447_01900 [Glycomyces halotolerans]
MPTYPNGREAVVDDDTHFLVFANFRWVHASGDPATALQVYWRMDTAAIGTELWIAAHHDAAKALKQTSDATPGRVDDALRLTSDQVRSLAAGVFA